MLLSDQIIAGLFDHHYLWKEEKKKITKEKQNLRLLLLAGCGQTCPENERIVHFKSTRSSVLTILYTKILAICFNNDEMLMLVIPNWPYFLLQYNE